MAPPHLLTAYPPRASWPQREAPPLSRFAAPWGAPPKVPQARSAGRHRTNFSIPLTRFVAPGGTPPEAPMAGHAPSDRILDITPDLSTVAGAGRCRKVSRSAPGTFRTAFRTRVLSGRIPDHKSAAGAGRCRKESRSASLLRQRPAPAAVVRNRTAGRCREESRSATSSDSGWRRPLLKDGRAQDASATAYGLPRRGCT